MFDVPLLQQFITTTTTPRPLDNWKQSASIGYQRLSQNNPGGGSSIILHFNRLAEAKAIDTILLATGQPRYTVS